MDVTVFKNESQSPVSVQLPPSKSVSHRLLIAAALSEGTSRIFGMARNKDTEATARCLRRLGAKIDLQSDPVLVTGPASPSLYDGKALDCGESATTLRFLLPLFAQGGRRCIFTGSGRLMERPQDVYEELYGKSGEFIRLCGSELTECFSQSVKDSFTGLITVKGTLSAGHFTVRGDISSQFISGLLFLLPLLDSSSQIDILPPFGSSPYVDLTLEALKTAGIKASLKREGLSQGGAGISPAASIFVPGKQKYTAFEARAEADWSSAAVMAVYSVLSRRPVLLNGACPGSLHADRAILGFAEKLGAGWTPAEGGVLIEPQPGGTVSPLTADLTDCPDLGPILFAAATQADGTSVFRGISRLRLKESDRVQCMQEELSKLGCRMKAGADEVLIDGPVRIEGGCTLDSHNDHRIAMALAVLAACAKKPVTIKGARAVEKSWPEFFEELQRCGAASVRQSEEDTL